MCPDILWPFGGAHKTATFFFIAPPDSHLLYLLLFKSCENMRAKVLHCYTKDIARSPEFY